MWPQRFQLCARNDFLRSGRRGPELSAPTERVSMRGLYPPYIYPNLRIRWHDTLGLSADRGQRTR